jgi:hypothetical protein
MRGFYEFLYAVPIFAARIAWIAKKRGESID